jgi:hypothetical protein
MRNMFILSLLLLLASCSAKTPGHQPGTLRVHPDNPRYFTDNSGRAIYLTGSHTWYNFQEPSNPEAGLFDYQRYLDFLEEYNHNFTRLWIWEQASWASWTPDTVLTRFGHPMPYPRTGPGMARDSLPRFDLGRFNQAHFSRLRARVEAAEKRGIYVQVMLFQGFSVRRQGSGTGRDDRGNPWWGHPYNVENNINGIDGDLDGDDLGDEVHMLSVPEVTKLQKAYIRKVIDTLNDMDNVIFEIANESHPKSMPWQYAMTDYIHEYEQTLPKQHPVLITMTIPSGSNEELFASPADAISPKVMENEDYKENPPPADGSKVIISDTDHLWGLGGSGAWVWKSFTRGHNPIFMDPLMRCYNYPPGVGPAEKPEYEEIRRQMGQTLRYAEKMDLAAMVPSGKLSSSGYCLANQTPGDAEYLVYLPEGGSVVVDLSATVGKLIVEWFEPEAGMVTETWTINGGSAATSLTAPFDGDAVLYIQTSAN